jgi:hypothetical protein
VRPDAWQAIWSNFVSDIGGTWTGYLAALNENAAYLDTLGAPTSEISRLFGFELRQAEGLNPIRYLASATEAAMPAPGPDLVFSQAFAQPISRRYEVGPLGRGWADNWQLSLATESDGTVRITDMTGTPRIFQPDSRDFVVAVAAGHAAVASDAGGHWHTLPSRPRAITESSRRSSAEGSNSPRPMAPSTTSAPTANSTLCRTPTLTASPVPTRAPS